MKNINDNIKKHKKYRCYGIDSILYARYVIFDNIHQRREPHGYGGKSICEIVPHVVFKQKQLYTHNVELPVFTDVISIIGNFTNDYPKYKRDCVVAYPFSTLILLFISLELINFSSGVFCIYI